MSTELITQLEELRRVHRQSEDCWYSCPKSGECCNDNLPDECNCGADEHNAKLDAVIANIERIPLEPPEDAKARWLRDHPVPVPLVDGYTSRPVESWKQWNPSLVSGVTEARALWGSKGAS